ncbi:MAG: helix-turn-helix transcriptional regulator [Pseudomonadota bacterium]
MSDEAVLKAFGDRLAARRIDLQMTQARLAEQAGIAKRTLERMEAGQSSQLTNLIRVLRVLELLPELNVLLPEAGPRPLDLLERGGRRRQRASRGKSAVEDHPWEWGDES